LKYNGDLLNQKLIDYLDTEEPNNFEYNQHVTVDYLTPELANSINRTGRFFGTHHSYSYKETNNAVNKYSNVLYKIPVVNTFLNNLGKTQNLTLSEQTLLGNSFFDIRISKFKGQLVVDHNIIFGTLKEFINDYEKAVENNNKILVYYKISSHNNEKLNFKEIKTFLKFNTNYHGNFRKKIKSIYLNTMSETKVLELLKTNHTENLQLILTPNASQLILFFIITVLIPFITSLLLFYFLKKYKYFN
jgi:hypothetical protein